MPNSIKINGVEKTIARVQKVGGNFGTSLLKGAIYLRGVLATYPPRRIPSAYIRTRNLGHRWATSLENDTRAKVGNNAPYARYVMDDAFQTNIMKQRDWKTVQEHARRERAEVVRIVKADLLAQIKQRTKQ